MDLGETFLGGFDALASAINEATQPKDEDFFSALGIAEDDEEQSQDGVIRTGILGEYISVGEEEKIATYLKHHPQKINVPERSGSYPIHLAVVHDRLNCLSMLIEAGADVNVYNQDSRTPLHVAIIDHKPHMVSMLLRNDADVTKQDLNFKMAIHTAAKAGSTQILKLLIPHYQDLDVPGEGGYTALHYAAQNDRADAIRLLINCGASIYLYCNAGDYAIHVACNNASPNALKALVEESIEKGMDVHSVLQKKDREGNTTIHAAVNGGSPEAVKVLLKFGAFLHEEKSDSSTPLLMAATSGNLKLIRTMKDTTPHQFAECLALNRDSLQRSPLHLSIIFNHPDVTKYLLEHGADLNAVDGEFHTPVLSAAYKGQLDCMHILLNFGADTSMRDKKNRNFVHLLMCSDVNMKNLKQGLKGIRFLSRRLSERDEDGNTPLHYAVRRGHMGMFHGLLELQVDIVAKNHNNQTVFHFAAMFGRTKCFAALLQNPTGAALKNDGDRFGMTALHYAAQRGHAKIIQMLLLKGATVTRDNKRNSPLHWAAQNGHKGCIQIMLNLYPKSLNQRNLEGDTALHLAANNSHTSCVIVLMSEGAQFISNTAGRTFYDGVLDNQCTLTALAIVNHDRWREVVAIPSKEYGTFLIGLIQKVPSVCVTLLDRCVHSTQSDAIGNYVVNYDFRYLLPPPNYEEFARHNKIRLKHGSLASLKEMSRYNRVECLSHPVCVTFLRMKWRTYGYIAHYLELMVYLVYLAFLTIFVVKVDSLEHTETYVVINNSSGNISDIMKGGHEPHNDDYGETLYAHAFVFDPITGMMVQFIVMYSCVNLVKEAMTFLFQPVVYLTKADNLLEWIVFGQAVCFMAPFFQYYSSHLQWELGICCVFFSWFKVLIFMQRFDFSGIYIVMFISIMKTIMKVVLIFSVLLVAFGLSFYMGMYNSPDRSYSSPILSTFTTLLMILELDSMASFSDLYNDGDDRTLHFGQSMYMLLAAYIFLMPILLVNLLIGLAVGDIEAVQRDARLKRLTTQVSFHTSLENTIPFLRTLSEETYQYTPPNLTKWWHKYYYRIMGDKDVENTNQEETSPLEMSNLRHRMNELTEHCNSNMELLQQILKKVSSEVNDDMWDDGPAYTEEMNDEN